MSGHNPKTGRFELTHTKACWWSRERRKTGVMPNLSMNEIAGRLTKGGVKIFRVHDAWIETENDVPKILKALRGQTWLKRA